MITPVRTLRRLLPAALLLASCASSRPAPEPAPAPGPAAEAPEAATAAPARAPEPAGPAAPAKARPIGVAVDPDAVIAPVNRNVLGGLNFASASVADAMEDLQAIKVGELRVGGESYDRNDLSEAVLGSIKATVVILGGPDAVVQTRVGWLGTQAGEPHNKPEDAAAAVRIAKAMGLKVRYWEIGNEPDLYGAKQSAPDYGPEKYCATFRAQAAAMKAVDPEVKVAGPVVSGAKPARDTFLEQFVKECGDVVDVLTWHIYPTDGGADDELALATAREADETVDAFRALWTDPRSNPKGHQRKIMLGVTEYALSWQSTRARHLTDMPGAMWAAETALRLNARGVDSAAYFALQGMQSHGLIDASGGRRPVWYAFLTLSKLSGNLVAAESGDDDVWAHAARNGDRLDLVLINKATAPRTVPVAVPGFTARYGVYFDEAVTRDERPVEKLAVGPTLTLPARSVAHVVFGLGDSPVADDYAAKPAAQPRPAEPAQAPAKAKKTTKKKTR